MASIIKKVKGGKPYYYIAVSKRVDGKPRIVQQTYLGSVDRILSVFNQKTAPEPVHAISLELGLPGGLWQAAQDSGARAALDAVWNPPRQGPALSHFLLLAAFHHVCNPDSNIEVAAWYERTVLRRLWDFPSDYFSSHAFWESFDSINVDPVPSPGQTETDDELLAARDRLLEAFRDRNFVSESAAAYDNANYHAWISSDNERSTLAQGGHDKQIRQNLRQVSLSYALDAAHGPSLMDGIDPESVSDSSELPEFLERVAGRLDGAGIPRDRFTLAIDNGSAALDNMLALERSGLGWIAALPWHRAPSELRHRPLEQMAPVGSPHPDLKALAERCIVNSTERLCVLMYSSINAAEQLQYASESLMKALEDLPRLALDLAQPQRQLPAEERVRKRVREALGPSPVPDLVEIKLTARDDRWELGFQADPGGLIQLFQERFGRTVLITNQDSWDAAEVVAAYGRHRDMDEVFRGRKEGGLAGCSPTDPGTDSKRKVEAFYCMLGVSLLQYMHQRASAAGCPDLTLEQLCAELREVRQFDLVYPPATKRSQPPVVSMPSRQSETQRSLVQALGIDRLIPAHNAKGAR